mgnify:CR=1 FL=1
MSKRATSAHSNANDENAENGSSTGVHQTTQGNKVFLQYPFLTKQPDLFLFLDCYC